MRFCILIGVPILIGKTCFIFITIGAVELNQYNFCNKTKCIYEPSADYADCKNKNLVTIPPQCSSAEYLDLRKNDLPNIGSSSTSLSKYTNLRYLYLDGNSIRNITPRAFEECSSLQQLFLQNNPILIILSKALAGLTDLRQLYLNLAQLQVIQQNAFDDLKALLRLFLSDNSLETLPAKLFQELHNLQILTLANNRLRTLSSDTFQGLIRLEYLDIKQNQLTILPNGLFNNMMILKRLTLSYNTIHTIEKNAINFDHLLNLENLDMRNNSITSVANFSTEILSISNIFLSNNPLNCSCHDINSLLMWYELHSDTTTARAPATCTTPSAFAGVPVQDIMANNTLSCDKIINSPSPANTLPAKTVILKTAYDFTTMLQNDAALESKVNSVIPGVVTYSVTLPYDVLNDTEILAQKIPQNVNTINFKYIAITVVTATAIILSLIIMFITVQCRREKKKKRKYSTTSTNNNTNQTIDGTYEQVKGSESIIFTNLDSPPPTPANPLNDIDSFPFIPAPSSTQFCYVPHSSMHPNHQQPSTNHAHRQLPDVAYVPHANHPYDVHIQTSIIDQNQHSPNFDATAHDSATSYHQTDLPSPPIPLPDVQLTTCKCLITHSPNNNPFCANMMQIHNNPICS